MSCFVKQIFIVLVVLIFTLDVYGQGKIINISKYDTSWYNHDTSVAKKVHLTNLTNHNKGISWRFWYTKFIASAFVIDLSRKNNSHCKASITLYTYGNVEGNTLKSDKKIYYKQIKLNSKEASRLFKLAGNININSYTNLEQIDNERAIKIYQTLDATPYIVEYADNKNYIFKACVRPNDSKDVKIFLDAADSVINFKWLNDVFEKSIPFAVYSSDQWQGKRKTLTDKQKQANVKYWKRHLQK